MRRFGIQGCVYPNENYVVRRTEEGAEFINRVKDGKYIVLFAPRQTGKTTFFRWALETKIWRGNKYYQAGKKQLAAYIAAEKATEGYYVVFDHRQAPEPRVETETLAGVTIRSYVIPVMQEVPSNTLHRKT